jgi:hypothetical protein
MLVLDPTGLGESSLEELQLLIELGKQRRGVGQVAGDGRILDLYAQVPQGGSRYRGGGALERVSLQTEAFEIAGVNQFLQQAQLPGRIAQKAGDDLTSEREVSRKAGYEFVFVENGLVVES